MRTQQNKIVFLLESAIRGSNQRLVEEDIDYEDFAQEDIDEDSRPFAIE